MPQPSINHVKVAGQGDNMPPPKENPGPWQSSTSKRPQLQNMPRDTNMSQMDAMGRATRDKQGKDSTSEQLDAMGLATSDQQSQDTNPEQMDTMGRATRAQQSQDISHEQPNANEEEQMKPSKEEQNQTTKVLGKSTTNTNRPRMKELTVKMEQATITVHLSMAHQHQQ